MMLNKKGPFGPTAHSRRLSANDLTMLAGIFNLPNNQLTDKMTGYIRPERTG